MAAPETQIERAIREADGGCTHIREERARIVLCCEHCLIKAVLPLIEAAKQRGAPGATVTKTT